MSRSALYTANTAAQAVAVNGTINLGSIIRRYGCNVNLSGSSAIMIDGPGYYDFDASITAAPTAAGTVTVTLFKDGVAIPGATASASTTTAGNPINLSIDCLLRENCACCDDASVLALVLTGSAASVLNVATVTEKI